MRQGKKKRKSLLSFRVYKAIPHHASTIWPLVEKGGGGGGEGKREKKAVAEPPCRRNVPARRKKSAAVHAQDEEGGGEKSEKSFSYSSYEVSVQSTRFVKAFISPGSAIPKEGKEKEKEKKRDQSLLFPRDLISRSKGSREKKKKEGKSQLLFWNFHSPGRWSIAPSPFSHPCTEKKGGDERTDRIPLPKMDTERRRIN